jgi:hypothetical protein
LLVLEVTPPAGFVDEVAVAKAKAVRKKVEPPKPLRCELPADARPSNDEGHDLVVPAKRSWSATFDPSFYCFGARERAMLVSGLPGIGKSRLLSELVQEARARFGGSLRLLVARGDPALAGHPFSLLGNALRRSAGIRADDKLDDRVAKLAAFIERDGPAPEGMLAFLGELLGLDLPDTLDPRLRAARRDPPPPSRLSAVA